MIKVLRNYSFLLVFAFSSFSAANNNEPAYLIGKGMGDITGPAFGSPMWGFSKPGQNTEGIHTRLKSRAFIFLDPETENRLLFASIDIGSIEHHIFLEVLDRLNERYGDLYRKDNTILSATHTHAGPAGYYHTRKHYSMSGPLQKEHFNRIVAGIVSSIEVAHNDLQPANILINKGDVIGAGANRSMKAYLANPEQEREKYESPMDLEMTLLRLQGSSGALGSLNWFAVHPTSMTYNSQLISGDNKGYASLTWEKNATDKAIYNKEFIAAFAQSTPGDITPNLNLDNTGPGKSDIESTRIIGQRQLDVAQLLFEQANEKISGPIASRQMYVNLSNYEVSNEFTGQGTQYTCPSAYGYAYAAGSTEDGGGHFLFSEGMKEQKWWLDVIVRTVTDTPEWTQAIKDCQAPKAILFETGSGEIPEQSQIRSFTIARIGSLAIVALPNEVTTMSARRIKETVKDVTGSWAKHIVIAGYSNGSAGYITTPEEYETQQYEGGHTRHGKWSLPAYQQILTNLGQSLENNAPSPSGPHYDDWRGKALTGNFVDAHIDKLPAGKSFGDLITIDKADVKVGEKIKAKFISGHPSTGYGANSLYVSIQKKAGDQWQQVHTDMDWSTIIRWQENNDSMHAHISWKVPLTTEQGTYRIKHFGNYRLAKNKVEFFEAVSPTFSVSKQ
ncbi:neutral/alkaline non-lysosomal ceramidase N-terminal domain-containing protein [Endozoicomonas atrinae]|uniref:neutral/alkaline non-lysosomal ceramidase N-terminal domain-containing protein n=1 Tax=Endozoicomonas atrinae TaxID=1333660 RepID=UPI0009F63F67|nr:neutral/alkaline non-lysosomal ceramidase N-terminal domain-containing protein [Endozoicomonas atrinae]